MSEITKQVKVKEVPPHRVLRETFRHYLDFREMVMGTGSNGEGADGRKHVIEHSYWVDDGKGGRVKKTIAISLWDLQVGLSELAPRKREAIFYNVILDWKQKDVAAKMGITTVSVGQYVEAGFLQLAKRYFADEYGEEIVEAINVEDED